MPLANSKKKIPEPNNTAANKLINNSLKMALLLAGPFFGRVTTAMKNHATKMVPIVNNTVAKYGNTDGRIGDI